MDIQRERDLAVIARIGGREYRRRLFYHPDWGNLDTYVGYAAPLVARGSDHKAYLPESALDWPIYRIAMPQCAVEDAIYALPSGTLYVRRNGEWSWRA